MHAVRRGEGREDQGEDARREVQDGSECAPEGGRERRSTLGALTRVVVLVQPRILVYQRRRAAAMALRVVTGPAALCDAGTRLTSDEQTRSDAQRAGRVLA